MAERDDLLRTLPPELHDDVAKLVSGTEEPDPHTVVAALHRKGLLTTGQLREAVLTLEATMKIRRVKLSPPDSANPTILGPLGEGAMGEVLIAKDEGLNRVVAIKRLHKDMAGRGAIARRFYSEAQVTAQLDHPGIVPIYSLVKEEGQGLAYTMKLVRGITLEDFFEEALADTKSAKHRLEKRLEVFMHICDAIAYAHDRGVLHRDLKPENIMVGAFGQVLVMDWGIAKLLENPKVEIVSEDGEVTTAKARQTKIGRVIGTPRFMSPEQARGENDKLSPKSDQYSLGLILQEMVTLGPAIQDDLDLEGALSWARKAKRMPIRHARGHRVARELDAIITKACAPKAEDRYATVAALAEDLRRYLRDEAVLARPDSISQRLQRFVGRHRMGVLVVIMGLMFSLVTLGAFLATSGVGAIAIAQHRADLWAEKMTDAVGDASRRASRIDRAVKDIESIVVGLSYAAEGRFVGVDHGEAPYDITQAPIQRSSSKLYKKDVVFDRPSMFLTNNDVEPHRDTFERMLLLGPSLGRALIDSSGEAKASKQRRSKRQSLVGNSGVPIVWAKVALVEGKGRARAGTLGQVPGINPLKREVPSFEKKDWFKNAIDSREVVWSTPRIDPQGQGLIVTSSTGIFKGKGVSEGVVAVDVGLDYLVARLDSPVGGKAYLVKDGLVYAHPGLTPRKMLKFEPTKFPDAAIWKQIEAKGKSGVISDGEMAWIWAPVEALGWTYVAHGKLSSFTGSK